MQPYKIFISYAHEDEDFKNVLCQHLKPLERSALLQVWQDRRIQAGDDWRQAIEAAMQECQLALLLISRAFLASDFIQLQELQTLQQRAQTQGIRLFPVIVKPCAWTLHELQSIQARPTDGRPVITFDEHNGARDQAWTEIVREIAAFAKQAAQQSASAASATNLQQSVPQNISSGGSAAQAAEDAACPFDPWHPVTPPRFVGRQRELRLLANALQQQRSLCVVGDSRIGKSSLLQTWQQQAQALGRNVFMLSGEGAERASPAALVQQLCASAPVADDVETAANHLQAWAAQIRLEEGMPALILWDEADCFLKKFPLPFFERLRGMLSQRLLCLVFATRHDPHSLFTERGSTSPLMNLVDKKSGY